MEDDRSSMKVGTDAVLLGAWCALPDEGVILDVGCGCGVVALMAAQRRPESLVMGLDIHAPSVQQANENARRSPFGNVRFLHKDFLSAAVFDFSAEAASPVVTCILSNPPYHTETLQSPESSRAMARSEAYLPFADFVVQAFRLLTENGHLQVIIPAAARSQFVTEALRCGFSLCRQCMVRTTARKAPRRVLLDFVKGTASAADFPLHTEELILQESPGMRSKAYSELCEAFYL